MFGEAATISAHFLIHAVLLRLRLRWVPAGTLNRYLHEWSPFCQA
jgi:hypothetical protein